MLNATRAAAVVAVLALSGSLALMAGAVDRSGEPPPLSAAESEGAGLDVTPGFFTGTARMEWSPEGPSTTALVDRLELRDLGATLRLDLDDPRVNGSTLAIVYDVDEFPVPDGEVGLMREGTGRMESVGGAWVVSFVHGASMNPEDGRSYTYATLIGEGGFDGLVGSLLMTDHDGAGGWQVTGTIFPEGNAPSE